MSSLQVKSEENQKENISSQTIIVFEKKLLKKYL
jgi:hypothetical protein